MHNYIARSISLPRTFYSTTCLSLPNVLTLLRSPSTAGLVVTMPYKNISTRWTGSRASSVRAIASVYKDGPTRRSVGSNTDWNGIVGSFLERDAERAKSGGGASRAAIYTLATYIMYCSTIYVLNRDEAEVADLLADSKKIASQPQVIHIKTGEDTKAADVPYYIQGTVPDMETESQAEKDVVAILDVFLAKEKGLLLDLCFKPRRTRMND